MTLDILKKRTTRQSKEKKRTLYNRTLKYILTGERMGKYSNTVRPEDAAKRLGLSVECLRECMKQNKFPVEIGVAIKKDGNKNFGYYIFENRLVELEKIWGFYS